MDKKYCFSIGHLFLLMGIVFAVLISPAIALAYSSDNVNDELNYLSENEIIEIQSEIEHVVNTHGLDIAIVITDNTDGKSSRSFADDYYDSHGFGIGNDASGLLLLINMDIREVWISTTGKAIDIFTDSRINSILDALIPDLSEGDYYNTCMEFIYQVEKYAQSGVPQGQYRQDENEYSPVMPQKHSSNTYWGRVVRLMATPIIYVIALVIAVIGTLIASSGSKGKVTVSNRTYEEGGSFELTAQRDDFINQTVTKVRVSSQSSSGGSRSSTHRGSSGRSHGGGGRRF